MPTRTPEQKVLRVAKYHARRDKRVSEGLCTQCDQRSLQSAIAYIQSTGVS